VNKLKHILRLSQQDYEILGEYVHNHIHTVYHGERLKWVGFI